MCPPPFSNFADFDDSYFLGYYVVIIQLHSVDYK